MHPGRCWPYLTMCFLFCVIQLCRHTTQCSPWPCRGIRTRAYGYVYMSTAMAMKWLKGTRLWAGYAGAGAVLHQATPRHRSIRIWHTDGHSDGELLGRATVCGLSSSGETPGDVSLLFWNHAQRQVIALQPGHGIRTNVLSSFYASAHWHFWEHYLARTSGSRSSSRSISVGGEGNIVGAHQSTISIAFATIAETGVLAETLRIVSPEALAVLVSTKQGDDSMTFELELRECSF